MTEFKVGDRVEYTGDNEDRGRIGTVIEVGGWGQPLVEYDDGQWQRRTPFPHNLRVLEPTSEPVPTRAQVLRDAEALITGDRNKTYGPPTQNFENIAQFWNTFLSHKLNEPITAGDTAACMILVKVAREIAGAKSDNKVDIAGYAACWAEVDDASSV